MTPAYRAAVLYLAEACSLPQLQASAEKCRTSGCPSYIHCYLAPTGDGKLPLPVCAREILKEKEDR